MSEARGPTWIPVIAARCCRPRHARRGDRRVADRLATRRRLSVDGHATRGATYSSRVDPNDTQDVDA